jgi:hypothetical protein
MSEDRPTLMFRPKGGIADQELADLRAKLEQAEAKFADSTKFCSGEFPCEASTTAASLERQLHDAEAERDEYERVMLHEKDMRESVARQRDALIAAIQRGYCPDVNCKWGQAHYADHSPGCRVAPLLTGGNDEHSQTR